MGKTEKKRMGRSPGTAENEQLVHVRIPNDLRDQLEEIREQLGEDDDKPSMSSVIRKALREYVRAKHREG